MPVTSPPWPTVKVVNEPAEAPSVPASRSEGAAICVICEKSTATVNDAAPGLEDGMAIIAGAGGALTNLPAVLKTTVNGVVVAATAAMAGIAGLPAIAATGGGPALAGTARTAGTA